MHSPGNRAGPRPRPAATPMRRTSSTALLESVHDVDHNEKYKQPPEDGVATRNVHVFRDAAYFLQVCSLCKRHLGPGTDIYMYRGDSAFCSEECRHEQIVIDERKEKYSAEARKMKAPSVPRNKYQSSATDQNVQAGTVDAV